MDVFRREVTVDVREVDLFRRLKLSELFRIMEQTAIAHTEVLNVGRAQTFDRGIFWALLLESVRIRRLPVYGEKIVILTWPGRTMHLFFPRFFRQIPDFRDHPVFNTDILRFGSIFNQRVFE